MDSGKLAPLPSFRYKKAGLKTDLLKSILVGRKNIDPAEMASIRRIITDTGFAKPQDYTTEGRFGRKVFRTLFGYGPNRMDILKARMRQGGLFGKGGVVHGDIAFDPALFDHIKKFKEGDRTFRRALSIGGHGLAGGLNVAFTAGLPLAAAAAYLKGEAPASEVAAESLSSLGMSIGAPFGLVGAMTGSTIGTGLGHLMGINGEASDPTATTTLSPAAKNGLSAARASARAFAGGMPAPSLNYMPYYSSFEAPAPEIYLPQQ
jgi:hypothetical protein